MRGINATKGFAYPYPTLKSIIQKYGKFCTNHLNDLVMSLKEISVSQNSSQNQQGKEEKSIDLFLMYAEMRMSALNFVLDVSFGLGKDGASSFARAEELSATIGEYLERIVALAHEILPV